jgi:CubicO group peptidase (beta-lactamase class C family)
MATAAATTVRDLMHHTSGIPGRVGDEDLFNGDDAEVALERHVRRLTSRTFERPGAATYEYSNVNYDAAGLLVAQVSGESFESYVQNHIFSPLGRSGPAAATRRPSPD